MTVSSFNPSSLWLRANNNLIDSNLVAHFCFSSLAPALSSHASVASGSGSAQFHRLLSLTSLCMLSFSATSIDELACSHYQLLVTIKAINGLSCLSSISLIQSPVSLRCSCLHRLEFLDFFLTKLPFIQELREVVLPRWGEMVNGGSTAVLRTHR